MKAAYVEGLGDAESIRYGELPDPVAGPGQVMVRVEAVAVNTVDTLARSGRWRTKVSFPLAVGRDLAGTVASVGPGMSDLGPGERVWTNSAGYGGRPGATAELVAVDRQRLYRLPPGADPSAFVASVHPGATVSFGTVASPMVSVVSASQLTAIAPSANASGVVNVTVTSNAPARPRATTSARTGRRPSARLPRHPGSRAAPARSP